MEYLNRLGLAQRIVMLVGLGIALALLGAYLVSLDNPLSNFGWFGYAPLNRRIVTAGSGLAAWQQLLIWLGLVLVWTVAGVLLLRRHEGDDPEG